MKIDVRPFLALIMALVPGACTDSLGGGISVASLGGGQASGVTTTSIDTGGQMIFINSDINGKSWLDDSVGNHVEENLQVTKGSGSYSCSFKNGNTKEHFEKPN